MTSNCPWCARVRNEEPGSTPGIHRTCARAYEILTWCCRFTVLPLPTNVPPVAVAANDVPPGLKKLLLKTPNAALPVAAAASVSPPPISPFTPMVPPNEEDSILVEDCLRTSDFMFRTDHERGFYGSTTTV
jgi:hypothetical protein